MGRFLILFLFLAGCAPTPLRWSPPSGKTKPNAEATPVPTAFPRPGVDTWFERLQTKIFNPQCVRCHNTQHPKGDVDLSSYEKIMDRLGLVIPNDPDNSQMYQVIAAEQMPPRDPLSEDDKALIFKWIEAGAPKEVTTEDQH